MTPRYQSEQQLHKAVAQLLAVGLSPPVYWSTIEHAGTSKLRGQILQGRGVKSGLPDLLVFHDGATFGIELKSHKGRLSSAQLHCHGKLAEAGVKIHVCRSINDVVRTLDDWRIPHQIHL